MSLIVTLSRILSALLFSFDFPFVIRFLVFGFVLVFSSFPLSKIIITSRRRIAFLSTRSVSLVYLFCISSYVSCSLRILVLCFGSVLSASKYLPLLLLSIIVRFCFVVAACRTQLQNLLFWHFHCSGGIPEFVTKYLELEDKGLLWEMIKMEIRATTIIFTKRKAKEKRDEEKDLLASFNSLQSQLRSNFNESIKVELDRVKNKLENMTAARTRGTIIRSKARWYEFGEMNCKYFYNLEKRNHKKNT